MKPGGEARIPKSRPRIWEAFLYRDFRLLCTGQFVSQTGLWMQFTSLTYLLGILLAHSEEQGSLNLGFLGAAQSIPALIAAPIGGYIADRFPRRRTLFLVALTRAACALGLAFVSTTRGPWVLPCALLLAAGATAAQAIDAPSRQSWISLLVPRQTLANAIGLAALAQQTPLMIGPAIAGILIGAIGLYPSFLLNALTQCAVIAVVLLMKPAAVANTSREPVLAQLLAGVRFVLAHPVLGKVVPVFAIGCLLVRPYNLLLAAFAGHVLHVGAGPYGTMLAAGGIGTLAGALITAAYPGDKRGRLWFVSGATVCTGILILSSVHELWIDLALLAIVGLTVLTFTSSTNVILQTLAPDEVRGRVLALFTMIILGMIPLGALLLGALAAAIGLPSAYATGAAITLVLLLWCWIGQPAVRSA